jgi:hypothetical protein
LLWRRRRGSVSIYRGAGCCGCPWRSSTAMAFQGVLEQCDARGRVLVSRRFWGACWRSQATSNHVGRVRGSGGKGGDAVAGDSARGQGCLSGGRWSSRGACWRREMARGGLGRRRTATLCRAQGVSGARPARSGHVGHGAFPAEQGSSSTIASAGVSSRARACWGTRLAWLAR